MATQLTALFVGEAIGLPSIDPSVVPDLPTALERLRGEQFDVVCLNLAAGAAPDAVTPVRQAAPVAVIVVAAPLAAAAQVLDYVRAGADDAIRFPPGVFELEHAILLARQRRASVEESALLGHYTARGTTSTAQLFGSTPLRQSHAQLFDALTDEYADILDVALDDKVFKVAPRAPLRLRTLAQKLSEQRASARDLIELHTAAIGLKLRSGEIGRVQGYVEESKLLLLELMGDMVGIYRNYAAAFWPRPRQLQ